MATVQTAGGVVGVHAGPFVVDLDCMGPQRLTIGQARELAEALVKAADAASFDKANQDPDLGIEWLFNDFRIVCSNKGCHRNADGRIAQFTDHNGKKFRLCKSCILRSAKLLLMNEGV